MDAVTRRVRPVLAAAALACAPAAPARAEPRELALGPLSVRYDAALWDASADGPGLRFTCRWRQCDGVAIGLAPAPEVEPPCSAETLLPAGSAERRPRVPVRSVERDGIVMHVAFLSMGCRNARPPELRACARHGASSYRLTAFHHGCRGGPSFAFEAQAETLLDGVSAR